MNDISSTNASLPARVIRILKDEGAKGVGWRLKRKASKHLTALLRLIFPPRCKLCGGRTSRRKAYGKTFHKCQTCEFIFTLDYNPMIVRKGMGMTGSWSGSDGGGYREEFLVKMLMTDLGMKSFLLYGTGNTPTFVKLSEEGVDVIGCDISQDVVKYKKAKFGNDSFFMPQDLPVERKYDAIVAVEVLEHLTEPKETISLLLSKLNVNGLICGTTNFYLGGSIDDDSKLYTRGYMSFNLHVAYWSQKSISRIASDYGYAVSAFEMISPLTGLPNKCIFFIHRACEHGAYFDNLLKTTPILPIDRP
ncbi:hypothetical protein ES707_14971 [subsurface metagenome]